jgi:KDO2-lipid IV(A) lauroyltransferase
LGQNKPNYILKFLYENFLRIFLFSFGTIVSLIPRKLELKIAPFIGKLICLLGYRKNVVRENIERCFPEKSEEEKKKLIDDFWSHFGILIFELLHYFSLIPGHYERFAKKYTRLHGKENWDEAYKKGTGVIFVASHLANWELMAAAGSLNCMPTVIVTKYLKPKWLHKRIEKIRLNLNIHGAYEPRTLPIILRTLREKGAIGFVMDQYAGPPIGVEVKFFGVEVGTLAAVGTLVSRTKASVLPAYTYRDKEGVIHVYLEPVIDLGEDLSDVKKSTQTLVSKVEEWVRRSPEQWLWTHRRFKNIKSNLEL